MMNKTIVPFINEVEKRAIFEEIFKETKIAVLDSNRIYRIKPWFLDESSRQTVIAFLKRRVPELEDNYILKFYQVGHYLLVFTRSTEELILALSIQGSLELLSLKDNEFVVKLDTGRACSFEKYTYDSKEKTLSKEVLEACPADCTLPEKASNYGQSSWGKIFVHPEEETKSTDNDLFYGYIVPLWEDS